VLRDQLQRCHVELRYYQVKYPNEAVHVETGGENDDLPPWVTSAEHMTPLLQVYDERIAELQKELAHQREMVDSFQEKVVVAIRFSQNHRRLDGRNSCRK
jgi:hypothetical protein